MAFKMLSDAFGLLGLLLLLGGVTVRGRDLLISEKAVIGHRIQDKINSDSESRQPHGWSSKAPILRGPYSKSIGSSSATNSFSTFYSPRNLPNSTEKWVQYDSAPTDSILYGAVATMSVHGHPNITMDQSVAAVIWVSNGLDGLSEQFNAIHVGWHVDPDIYNGDTRTRIFTYWTADGYRSTGCYNLRCDGFKVLPNVSVGPGSVISPLSTIGGQQYDITFKVSKDQNSGDWWVHQGIDGIFSPLGYFPSSLFTGLKDHATEVSFGGYVSFKKKGPSPPMGSGVANSDNAAFFKYVGYIDINGKTSYPKIAIRPNYEDNCYWLGQFNFNKDEFRYGGPAGSCNL